MADGPPAPYVLPQRPEREAVAREPLVEVLPDVAGRRLDRRADPPGRVVQLGIEVGVGVDVVVVEAPQHVAAVTPDVEVLGTR